MKTYAKILYLSGAVILMAGCGDDGYEEPANDAAEEKPVIEPVTEEEEDTSTNEEEAPGEEVMTEETEEPAEADPLAPYTSKQIEYARVWLQLGPNQDLDGLYVREIPAGTPLNPDDETSAVYPEDVIQLAGSRLVDGVVTYSGNGNGTINLYNVPLRWDGQYPAGKEFYDELIENTELVAIDVGKDEEVIRLIELLTTQEQ